jgi:lipoic acid synthetase
VVTSVNRDDDLLGGARAFAMVIEEIRRQAPGCRVEVLIPDFQGNQEAIRIVVEARPDVLNHNTESVPRLYRVVRSGARYERLAGVVALLQRVAPRRVTKSGVMVGLGEETAELLRSSAIWPRSAATSSPSASICAPRAITCPWPGSTRRASLPS